MLSLVSSSLSLNVAALSPGLTTSSRVPSVSMAQAIGSTLVRSRDILWEGKGNRPLDVMGKVVPTALPSKAPATSSPVSEAEVLECQTKWANAIASISSVYLKEGDYVAAAAEAAGELYGYGHHNVLFKPTKATAHPFRPTGEVAMSYFVGADAMDMDEFKGEDAGFAINGGKGWSNVEFTNHQIDLNGATATAMGSYDFTCATTGDVATVKYTFGYKRCADGKPRICLHHSSVPYSA